MTTTDDARAGAILRLLTKLKTGTAGLDPHDAAVMIVEIPSPDRANWIDLIGEVLLTHPFVKDDGTSCTRARAIIEADVRVLLGLDEPGAPTLPTPLASRAVPLDRAPELATTAYDREHRSLRSVR